VILPVVKSSSNMKNNAGKGIVHSSEIKDIIVRFAVYWCKICHTSPSKARPVYFNFSLR